MAVTNVCIVCRAETRHCWRCVNKSLFFYTLLTTTSLKGYTSDLPPSQTDVSQKCTVQDLKNGVGLGWKSKVRNSVTRWFMTMVFDDKCTVEACCCFQQETGSCCTPCKSHATLRLTGPACCAWPGLCKRSSTSSGLLLQSHTCKKWVEKVRI